MDRRSFLRSATLVLPALAGCQTDQEFGGEVPQFLKSRRLGLIANPLGFAADMSNQFNMNARASENLYLGEKFKAAFERHTLEFAPEMRKHLVRAFLAHGVSAVEIPFRPELHTRGYPAYGTAEKFYLQCRPYLYFARLADGFTPGITSAVALLAPAGRLLYSTSAGFGPNARSEMHRATTERFHHVDEITRSTERVSRYLMRMAAPVAEVTADTFMKEVGT